MKGKHLLVLLVALSIVFGCTEGGREVAMEKKSTWPLMIFQPIKADTNGITLYLEDLLLEKDSILDVGTTFGFSDDWTPGMDSFHITVEHTFPYGGTLYFKTPRGRIDYPILFNTPDKNESHFSESPLMWPESFSGDTVHLASIDDTVYPFVFWNNVRLLGRRYRPNVYSVVIPDTAKKMERSYLRVWSWRQNVWGHDLVVPLEYGKVITSGGQLDRKDQEAQRMYFVLVDRFNNGSPENDAQVRDDRLTAKTNYFGGDIKGVTQKIAEGYFDSLNINAIWLSPITQNPEGAYQEYPEPRRWYSGYHGYWPIRSSVVDHRFGSDKDMRELVKAAHEHGISILLDYVCNHIHKEHPMYQAHPEYATQLDLPDGTKNIRIWDDQRLTTWFDDFLPSLDLSNPEVIELQSDSALFWLKEYGIDGFRHDATKHVPDVFWKTLTRKIKDSVILKENRPVYQIGETYGDPELISSYITNGQLDAQFDFNLFFTVRDELAKENGDLNAVADKLEESLRFYGFRNSMGYISGNHDQPRFTAYASGALKFGENEREAGFERQIEIEDSTALLKMAQLIAFNNAIPGVPVIYYGDEIGMTGAGDPDNRRPMRFKEWTPKEKKLYETIKEINKLRSEQIALVYGDLELIHRADKSLVIKRKYFDQEILFLLNIGDSPLDLEIPVKDVDQWTGSTPSFNNARIQSGGEASIRITIPEHSFDFIIK